MMNKELYNIGLRILEEGHSSDGLSDYGHLFYEPIIYIASNIFSHSLKSPQEDLASDITIISKWDDSIKHLQTVLQGVGLFDRVEDKPFTDPLIDNETKEYTFYYSYTVEIIANQENRFELLDIR